MARPCSICTHPARGEIDQALVAGEAAAAVSARYRTKSGRLLGRMAMQRHREEHIPPTLAKAQSAVEVANADDLLAQVRTLHAKALGILDTAEAAGQLMAALAAIREARGCLELLGKLMGEIDERPQVHLHLSAEWLSVRAALVDVLAPYPEARAAVVERLRRLEAA